MSEMIFRSGERDQNLRVDAYKHDDPEFQYGIEIRIWGAPTYGLTVEEATRLRDRLTEALNACTPAAQEQTIHE